MNDEYVIIAEKNRKTFFYGIDTNSGGYPVFTESPRAAERFKTVKEAREHIEGLSRFSYLNEYTPVLCKVRYEPVLNFD